MAHSLLIAVIAAFLWTSDPPAPAPSTAGAHFVGSKQCESCHAETYASWRQTRMANVVEDPKQHPEAVLGDFTHPDPNVTFTLDQVAFTYGSRWKQRYFTLIGDDYYVLPAQWDVAKKKWLPYHVADGTDWWTAHYPSDNMQRPTGPLCDGCHSVNYDIATKRVTEWNVGCEKCHGPGSEHAQRPSTTNIVNPARLDFVRANDVCIQCHSQGQPIGNPIQGKYYDWPVGFVAGHDLKDVWRLEEHKLGEESFNYFADGTAHKNRMQGNDFTQSVMYTRGITCATCHDVHGTSNNADLRKPASVMCLECHGPKSPMGPHTATIEQHTHHKRGSAGDECVACHMPKIETEIGDVNVRAHTFKFIAPLAAEKSKMPNACNACHADKTPA